MSRHVTGHPIQTRSIRVFVSSTFRDMIEDRDALMTHAWPELRQFCRDRHVAFVEVDLRWGIPEEQSRRNETIKRCLEEITASRPYFIGLLGERYGWIPSDEAFTGDLLEEQPWLSELQGRSVTELEIIHGVLRREQASGQAFFYFRDPRYVDNVPPEQRQDFVSESGYAEEKLRDLKQRIRGARAAGACHLREGYRNGRQLAELIVKDLKLAIDKEFPVAEVPDSLTREAIDHEAFAETRRRTYVCRAEYMTALDRHAAGENGPLLLAGEAGIGKSAVLANWLAHWRADHPRDLIIQHYIGSTPDSADHCRLITRLLAEIKRWTGAPEDLPSRYAEAAEALPAWLEKARSKATRDDVRCIIVLDALNQLAPGDSAELLSWLPEHALSGPLRMLASACPGEALDMARKRGWDVLAVVPLTPGERSQVVSEYLQRFGKTLARNEIERLAEAPAVANPLYLKILLDELRVTGTHERLGERLSTYLAAPDIPALLQIVLSRYREDYEGDRPDLVIKTLGLIWAARRGLTEDELLRLLRADDQPSLPPALWVPFRAALEENLVDHAGVLNFAHDSLREAVGAMHSPQERTLELLRRELADEFEAQPVSARTADELPWLLMVTGQWDRLRDCILDIDRFELIHQRDAQELMQYWVRLGEERAMGSRYLESFQHWASSEKRRTGMMFAFRLDKDRINDDDYIRELASLQEASRTDAARSRTARAASRLGQFLLRAGLHDEAESLLRRALELGEQTPALDERVAVVATEEPDGPVQHYQSSTTDGPDHSTPHTAEPDQNMSQPSDSLRLVSLAQVLIGKAEFAEAEALLRRALAIDEERHGPEHPRVATDLNNLAELLRETHRLEEAEPLLRRAIEIAEKCSGPDHPSISASLNNLGLLLEDTNRIEEAEVMMRRALEVDERAFGPEHPNVAIRLGNLVQMLAVTGRVAEAESAARRALQIDEGSFGPHHPQIAVRLQNLAGLIAMLDRGEEAEPLLRRALKIDEATFEAVHPAIARDSRTLASLLVRGRQFEEAETLLSRSLHINEEVFGSSSPDVAHDLEELTQLLVATGRSDEAETHARRALQIAESAFGPDHPDLAVKLNRLAQVLCAGNRFAEAEPVARRMVEVLHRASTTSGQPHRHLRTAVEQYAGLLEIMGYSNEAIARCLTEMGVLSRSPTSGVPSEAGDESATTLAEEARRRERDLGPDHPTTLDAKESLARHLAASRRLPEAEALVRTCAERREAVAGSDHPSLIRPLQLLVEILGQTERQLEAIPVIERLLRAQRARGDQDDEDTAETLENLGGALARAGQHDRAGEVLEEAYQLRRNLCGPQHPATLRMAGNLGCHYFMLKDYEKAEKLFLETIRFRRKVLGDDDPETVMNARNLGLLYEALGRPRRARPFYEEVCRTLSAVVGDGHPQTLSAIDRISALLIEIGRSDSAVAWFTRALVARAERLGPEHRETIETRKNLAAAYLASDRYAEAEGLFLQVLQSMEQLCQESDPALVQAYYDVGHTQLLLGKPADARTHLATALQLAEVVFGRDSAETGIVRDRFSEAAQTVTGREEASGDRDRSGGHGGHVLN